MHFHPGISRTSTLHSREFQELYRRLLFGLLGFCVYSSSIALEVLDSERHTFEVSILSDELDQPWGLAFLPSGNMLVTEKPGTLKLLGKGGKTIATLPKIPDVTLKGQGGLMGIAIHPDFASNRRIYLSYAAGGWRGHGTEVISAVLKNDGLTGFRKLFTARAKSRGGNHFGSRLIFAGDGTLYVSLGDRGSKDSAQDLDDHRGSLVRLTDAGKIPPDNPFIDTRGARPEIFSYGHRNMQGMALHPFTGEIWTHEHGPQGGDEINVNRPGRNYGWPVITYGVNYGIGTSIGEGTHKDGMEQPLYKWVPSIAPSGMAFYSGEVFPKWKGNLFVGSLKFASLVRLELDGEKVIHEERLLSNRFGRIRDVVSGPDGNIYLLTDGSNGKLICISFPGKDN